MIVWQVQVAFVVETKLRLEVWREKVEINFLSKELGREMANNEMRERKFLVDDSVEAVRSRKLHKKEATSEEMKIKSDSLFSV